MRICPVCGKEYDDSWSKCLVDDAPLTADDSRPAPPRPASPAPRAGGPSGFAVLAVICALVGLTLYLSGTAARTFHRSSGKEKVPPAGAAIAAAGDRIAQQEFLADFLGDRPESARPSDAKSPDSLWPVAESIPLDPQDLMTAVPPDRLPEGWNHRVVRRIYFPILLRDQGKRQHPKPEDLYAVGRVRLDVKRNVAGAWTLDLEFALLRNTKEKVDSDFFSMQKSFSFDKPETGVFAFEGKNLKELETFAGAFARGFFLSRDARTPSRITFFGRPLPVMSPDRRMLSAGFAGIAAKGVRTSLLTDLPEYPILFQKGTDLSRVDSARLVRLLTDERIRTYAEKAGLTVTKIPEK